MRRRVWVDVHKGGVHEIDVPEIETDDDCYHLGDIHDLKGCKKKRVNAVKYLIGRLRTASAHYVSGNHELGTDSEFFHHVHNGVLFTHGDIPAWGFAKAKKFRNKKPGRGFFSRNLLRPIYSLRGLKNMATCASFYCPVATTNWIYRKEIGKWTQYLQ